MRGFVAYCRRVAHGVVVRLVFRLVLIGLTVALPCCLARPALAAGGTSYEVVADAVAAYKGENSRSFRTYGDWYAYVDAAIKSEPVVSFDYWAGGEPTNLVGLAKALASAMGLESQMIIEYQAVPGPLFENTKQVGLYPAPDSDYHNLVDFWIFNMVNQSHLRRELLDWVVYYVESSGDDFPSGGSGSGGSGSGGGSGSSTNFTNSTPLLAVDAVGSSAWIQQSVSGEGLAGSTNPMRWIAGNFTVPMVTTSTQQFDVVSGAGVPAAITSSVGFENLQTVLEGYDYWMLLVCPKRNNGNNLYPGTRPSYYLYGSASPMTLTVTKSSTDRNGHDVYQVGVTSDADIYRLQTSGATVTADSVVSAENMAWVENSRWSAVSPAVVNPNITYAYGVWAYWPGIPGDSGSSAPDDGWENGEMPSAPVINVDTSGFTDLSEYLKLINDNLSALASWMHGMADTFLGVFNQLGDRVTSSISGLDDSVNGWGRTVANELAQVRMQLEFIAGHVESIDMKMDTVNSDQTVTSSQLQAQTSELRTQVDALTHKFPFSLVGDVGALVAALGAGSSGNAGNAGMQLAGTWNMSALGMGSYTVNYDFGLVSGLSQYTQPASLIIFAFGLIAATPNIIRLFDLF